MKKRVISLFLTVLMVLSVVAVPVFAAEESGEAQRDWREIMQMDKTKMQEFYGVHPRIFKNQEQFNELKEQALSGEYPYVTKLYDRILAEADSYVQSPPSLGDSITQSHGIHLAPLAFAYQMTGDMKYVDCGWEMASKICALLSEAGSTNSISDMRFKNSFWGVGLFFDWCYNALTGGQKYYIVNCLSVGGDSMERGAWWRSGYLYNYPMHCRGGVALAGLAIFDEYEGAMEWIQVALNSFAYTVNLWPTDGTSVEGPMYSNLALGDVMMLNVAFNDICGVDYLKDPIFKNYIAFTIHNSISRNSWSAQVDQFGYGDSTQSSGFDYTSYMSLLANYWQDPAAQWYVEEMLDVKEAAGVTAALEELYTLLFYDKDLKAIHPAETEEAEDVYPVDRVFNDTGHVYLREDWSGNEDIMFFHCGPNMGIRAAEFQQTFMYDLGNGHPHPDQIGLLLHSNGEWLFADDGYTTGWSKGHNVPLINGIGQIGEWSGENSFVHFYGNQGSWPIIKRWTTTQTKILKTEFQGDLSYVLCDATLIYFKEENNLEHVYRHYIYSRSNKALLVIDDFSGSVVNEYQTRWRPNVQTPAMQADGSYLYVGGTTEMQLKAFPNANTVVKNQMETVAAGKEGGTTDTLIFSQTESGLNVRLATAITWQDKGTRPVNVEMKEKDGVYTFTIGNSEVVFDAVAHTVEQYVPESEFNVVVDKQLMHYRNQPILKDGTILADVTETLNAMGYTGKYDPTAQTYNATIDGKELTMKVGSNTVNLGNESFTVLENAQLVGGVFFAPVRALAQAADIAIYYDDTAKCAVMDSEMDKKNAELFAMAVDGETLTPNEDGIYEKEMFGADVTITPVAQVKGANISIDKCDGAFGESTVYITSADGSVTNSYKVVTKPISTVGNLSVYNITSDSAGLLEMKSTVDKDYDTAWPVQGAGPYIVYDLGQTCKLNNIRIGFLHGASRRQIVTIQVSDDNENFTTLFYGKASGTTTTGDDFPVDGSGRYVKIILGGHTNGGGWNNTSEVGFFGSY